MLGFSQEIEMKLPAERFGGLSALWARSAGIALACAIFASAMLGSAPAWSQSPPMLTFVAVTTDTTVEGGDDVELRIGLPSQFEGKQLVLQLVAGGTAVRGTDYSLIAADSPPGIVLGGEANSTITLSVDSAPAEPLSLLLRPRAADGIDQGSRSLSLQISGYQVVPETTETATVVLPPALELTIRDGALPTVQQLVLGGTFGDFACVILNGGSVRCGGANFYRQSTPPPDLGPVTQLGLGDFFACALTIVGGVRCWGREGFEEITPPDILEPVAQLVVSGFHSCVVTDSGQVHCWGDDEFDQSSPTMSLSPVAQIGLGDRHSCALTVGGEVHCWGSDDDGQSTPPSDLGTVVQLGVGQFHNCALTDLAQVRCWGLNADGSGSGRARPPDDLGTVAQLAVGNDHSCVLTVSRQLRCWGVSVGTESKRGTLWPPDDLGPVAQLMLGNAHTCARMVSGLLRCWGNLDVDIPSLPPGSVTAIDFYGLCALLAEGSVYCPNNLDFVPPELRPGEVVMSIWPRQLQFGQRAAIRFAALGENAAAFETSNVRIAVFGDGSADIGSHYRLLDNNSVPVVAESDGSYLFAGSPALASLEALTYSQPARLYIQPLELLTATGPGPSIRKAAQLIELIELRDGPFLAASSDTVTEGDEEVQINIWLPPTHTGLQVELELAVIGTAKMGPDYTLVAADPAQGIVLGGEANSTITLSVDNAPAEPLRLLLRPRSNDGIDQGSRSLSLRISAYQVVPETTETATVVLPPAVDLTIRDGEPPLVLTFVAVTTDTTVEGGGDVELSIGLPSQFLGKQLVLQIVAGGTAVRGTDYSLIVADSPPGVVLGGEANSTITLSVDSAPAEPLRLLLRPRAADGIDQGSRSLSLRISGYQVVPEITETVVLPPAVDLTIRDGEPPLVLTFVAVTTDTTVEGGDDVELSIGLPSQFLGKQLVLQIVAGGTAVRGTDYSLIVADSPPGIMLGGEANSTITLSVNPAPAEPLRLLLRPRLDDGISQGSRLLSLRISGYQVVPEITATVVLPPALDLTIRDDEPPTVQQVLVGRNSDRNFACVLLNGGTVRCGGNNTDGRATPPDDLPPVAQLGVGSNHSCAVTISGQLHCWGSDENGRITPPDILGPVAQLVVGENHSCAVTDSGQVHCWGDDAAGQSSPTASLGAVAQVGVGESYTCALTVSGELRCWGSDADGRSTPPDDGMGPFAQLAVGRNHACALTVSGEVRCWGSNDAGQSSPTVSLAPVAQVGVGDSHSCALTVSGAVRCWGSDGDPADGRTMPPDDLAQVEQLTVGNAHTCARTVSGELRCWGDVVELSSLPPGSVTAVDFYGLCALLAEGSVYCPNNLDLVPPELRPGEVVMSVWPQRLVLEQRATIRYTLLGENAAAIEASNVRIAVFGDGSADIGSYYRLLDINSVPVVAEEDGGYISAVNLEALTAGLGSRLYVQPLELLSTAGSDLSIRKVAQPIELLDQPLLTVSSDTVTEGGEGVPLSIRLPPTDTGLQVELELAAIGTAKVGPDYTLVAADPAQGIVLSDEANATTITLRVDSAPAEPLRLLLRPRADDGISQGDRFLNLRISRYQVVSASGEAETTVDLSPAVDLTILDDDPPTVVRVQVGQYNNFACVLSTNGSLRCEGESTRGQATPPDDLGPDRALGPVAQLALGRWHSCALTVSGQVRCWGFDSNGRTTPPEDLAPVVQLAAARDHSCALTVLGQVRCWGVDTLGRATPPEDLPPVAQIGLSEVHGCALTVSGEVHCWGRRDLGDAVPPDNLGQVAQLAVYERHSCALTVSGEVRCWGRRIAGDFKPPEGLGPFAQVGVGENYFCALTVSGEVHCWGWEATGDLGDPADGRTRPPSDLGSALQLTVGHKHSCARTVSGQLRCWGDVSDVFSSLPPGAVTAVSDPVGLCALLAEGSVVCPDNPSLVPSGLGASDVVMGVWPRQLQPGERAAIRFADLRETTAAFTVRIEVFGDGSADIGSYYRLLDSNGKPLVAAEGGGYLLGGGSPQLAGNPPMVWLEALAAGRGSRLYVRPIELMAAGAAPSMRKVAQPIELLDDPLFTASSNTVTEGVGEASLSILLPLAHTDLQVELTLAVIGTARLGLDFTLVAAEPAPGIMLSSEATDEITLRVDSAPAEPLRLLLRRADDRISQGSRFLNLRISRYQVVPASGEAETTVNLPPALDLTILDDDPLTVVQVEAGRNGRFACVLLNSGSLRCGGNNEHGRATPPADDLGPFAQLAASLNHSCAVTVSGQLRCWGLNDAGQSTPPADLGPFVQLAVGEHHSCAVTDSGQVSCWGRDSFGRASPPGGLGPVAQVGVGLFYSCALLVSGQVRCWGRRNNDRLTSPDSGPGGVLGKATQLAVGYTHSCALTVSGEVRCWGNPSNNQTVPPDGLGPVAQIGVGQFYSCALTVSGQVHCWGFSGNGRNRPPSDLGLVEQLTVGFEHSCARTVSGQVRCWGVASTAFSSLPPGVVVAVSKTSGVCALLADGSAYCPNNSDFVPPELRPSEVVMSVWPRGLLPGEQAAIHFADLRNPAGAFSARIEVFGEGVADIGSDYSLLDSNGQPLAETNGGYLIEGVGGNPPMAWLEASVDSQPSRLYVRPLELLSASGSAPSIRKVAQQVELRGIRLILRMRGGVGQLLTAGMALIPLQLSLIDSDGGPLDESTVLTVQLQAMVGGDATVVPDEPFEITVSDTVAVTTEVLVILDTSAETTLHFSVSDLPPGVVLASFPTVLRVTRPETPPALDIIADARVDAEDLVLLLRFLSAGPDSLSPRMDAAEVQARLDSLLSADVVDLRLDLDGDNTVDTIDLRIILRYLAGLRDAALGEGVQSADVEALFQPNP